MRKKYIRLASAALCLLLAAAGTPWRVAAEDVGTSALELLPDAVEETVTAVPGDDDRTLPPAVRLSEGTAVSWTVAIPSSGRYWLEIGYYYEDQEDADPASVRVLQNGEAAAPLTEAVTMEMAWRDEPVGREDSQGNAYRPRQAAVQRELIKRLTDPDTGAARPLAFDWGAGTRRITLMAVSGSLCVSRLRLVPAADPLPYAQQLAAWKQAGIADAARELTVEAELPNAKSDASILPLNDRTSPLTTPYDPVKIRYNTIGGGSWSQAGQWVEWLVDAPETGLYELSLRYRQNEKVNDNSVRALLVDGELPFAEAEALLFPYSSGFRREAVGGEDGAYRIYLTKGEHRLRLQAVLGHFEQVSDEILQEIGELNRLYREVVMVTGPTPDKYRDYRFPKLIPDTLADMAAVSARLKELEEMVRRLAGSGGEGATALRRAYLQLDGMVKDSNTIPSRLSDYKNTITTLSSWLFSSLQQPLELDTLTLKATETKLPKGEAGFFASAAHYIRQYIASFSLDYAQVGLSGDVVEESITVWSTTAGGVNTLAGSNARMTSGRDQSQLIADLARNLFTPAERIGVNIQLVGSDSLLPAILAGKGPDVAMGQTQTEPLNFALRGAVADLNRFPGAAEVRARFAPSALEPFTSGDAWYALPETQSYPMLFYRKDILEELGVDLTHLDTWETVLETVVPILQKRYLEMGISADLNNYAMFLYQNGGDVYAASGDRCAWDEPVGITQFERFCELYSDYKFPITFDFSNRFRSGEMPLAIQEFTAYNQLSVFAPEIEGLWGMRPVPGVRREDGSVDRAAAGTVTGCVILESSDKQDAAWEFVKWWTAASTQKQYSREMETLLGTAARNPTANREAMDSVRWAPEIAEALRDQQAFVRALPEVPGGYFTARHFNFAFRGVVSDGKEPKEALFGAIEDINREIEKKRREFDDRINH